MEAILIDINQNYVKIEPGEKRKNNKIIDEVLKVVTTELKRDELFNYLFEENEYTGSYYKNLKIKNANEFDINMLLVLPKEILKNSKVDTFDYPGTAQVKLNFTYCSQDRELREKIRTKLCDGDYLDCSKVNKWFESLIQKSLNNIKDDLQCRSNLDLKMHKSGPAKTLVINNEISMDLVPCFKFNRNNHELLNYQDTNIKEYLLVPKISEGRITHNKERFWRVSLPKQEKELLNDADKLKSAIRILKLIRDDKNHKQISSYYIQTVGMHNLASVKCNRTLTDTFLQVLHSLIIYLEDENIPFYWCNEFNLLSSIKKQYLEDLKGFWSNFQKKIKSNPRKLYDYISVNIKIDQEQNETSNCTMQ